MKLKSVVRVIVILIALFVVVQIQNGQSHIEALGNKSAPLAIPAQILKHVILGQNLLVADLLWLRLIQNIDFKEPEKTEKGWVFQMLDGITTLDPRYKIAYRAGNTVLSVLVEDKVGAAIIYDRGAENFPDDWPLLYRAGYHYLFELGDCPKAATYLVKAAQAGGPKWIEALAGRIMIASGQYDLAQSVLEDALERFKGTSYEIRFKWRLDDLKKARERGELPKLSVPCSRP
ncbi:MAG: hypothetical protein IT289_01350 [Oligoflexia bacterium]|nr:hypothetical protein [Oligoflexia bacterium]